MALNRWGWVGVPVWLVMHGGVAWAEEPTALDRQRAAEVAGKFKEVTLDPAKFNISEATPLGAAPEKPALRSAALLDVPAAVGTLDGQVLKTEVNQRTRELESCRTNLASTTGLAPAQINAGSIVLRWTILPSGRTRNAVVLEREPTDLDVMRCARKRVASWQFTPPVGGPAPVEQAFRFEKLASPAPEPLAESEPKPATATPDKTASEAAAAAP